MLIGRFLLTVMLTPRKTLFPSTPFCDLIPRRFLPSRVRLVWPPSMVICKYSTILKTPRTFQSVSRPPLAYPLPRTAIPGIGDCLPFSKTCPVSSLGWFVGSRIKNGFFFLTGPPLIPLRAPAETVVYVPPASYPFGFFDPFDNDHFGFPRLPPPFLLLLLFEITASF